MSLNSDNSQIYFLPIKMNGNVASSPIKKNFLPIIDNALIGRYFEPYNMEKFLAIDVFDKDKQNLQYQLHPISKQG